MRSSIAVASLCAAFAVASPIVKKGLEIVATHVDVVTNVVMVTVTGEPVTVTAGAAVPSFPPVVVTVPYQSRSHRHSHSNSQPSYAPAPTSTTPAVVVVTETQAASSQAPYTTPAAAAIVPTTSSSTSSAPVASSTAATAASDPVSATAVSVHNDARASHQASSMTWNQTLADYALQESSCTKFAHDLTAGGGGYGQNIAVAGNSDSGAYTTEGALAAAMKEWYDEESLFGSLYGVASPSEAVGDFLHFTQMVWQDSHQVGCAVKTCGTDNSIYPGMYVWYSTCNYYPAGNVIGEFATNVLS